MTKSAPSSASLAPVGQPDRPGPSGLADDPLGEGADDRESLRIDVQQDQLVDREAVACG